jgi:hypothetical protein
MKKQALKLRPSLPVELPWMDREIIPWGTHGNSIEEDSVPHSSGWKPGRGRDKAA